MYHGPSSSRLDPIYPNEDLHSFDNNTFCCLSAASNSSATKPLPALGTDLESSQQKYLKLVIPTTTRTAYHILQMHIKNFIILFRGAPTTNAGVADCFTILHKNTTFFYSI